MSCETKRFIVCKHSYFRFKRQVAYKYKTNYFDIILTLFLGAVCVSLILTISLTNIFVVELQSHRTVSQTMWYFNAFTNNTDLFYLQIKIWLHQRMLAFEDMKWKGLYHHFNIAVRRTCIKESYRLAVVLLSWSLWNIWTVCVTFSEEVTLKTWQEYLCIYNTL